MKDGRDNIYYDFSQRKFFSYITIDYVHYYLGLWDSYSDAKAAYSRAAKRAEGSGRVIMNR